MARVVFLLLVVFGLAAGVWLWLDDDLQAADSAVVTTDGGPAASEGTVLPTPEAAEARPIDVAEAERQDVARIVDDAVQQLFGGKASDGPTVTVVGRVTDEAGRAVAGAEVSLLSGALPQMGMLALSSITTSDSLSVSFGESKTETDDDGGFRFDVPLPEPPDDDEAPRPTLLLDALEDGDRLLVAHPAFVAREQALPQLAEVVVGGDGQPTPDELDAGVIVLAPAGRIVGRVFDAHGRPLADARLGVKSAAERNALDFSTLFDTMLGSVEETTSTGRSGPDGRFELSGLSPGPVHLYVAADDHPRLKVSDLVVEAGRVTQVGDVHLDPGGSVAGVVLDGEGQPVPGLEVTLQSQPAQGLDALADFSAQLLVGDLRREIDTDEAGRFLFTGVTGGSARLRAGGDDGWSRDEQTVTIDASGESDSDELVMRIERLGDLIVRVVDNVGAARDLFGPWPGLSKKEAYARRKTVDIEAEQVEDDGGLDLEVVSGAELVELVAQETAAGLRVPGDPLPQDLTGVVLLRGAGQQGSVLTLSADGLATLRHTEPGLAPGRRRAVELVLRSEATLAGVVVDDREQPVVGARVEAVLHTPDDDGALESSGGLMSMSTTLDLGQDTRDDTTRRATTDEQGRFVLHGLDAARWSVEAEAEGMLDGEAQVVGLRDAEQRDGLRFVLRPGGTVAGRVHEPDGGPVPGAMLSLVPAGGGTSVDPDDPEPGLKKNMEQMFALTITGSAGDARQVKTDADGRYRMAGLRPGVYELSLKRDSMAPLGLDIGAMLGGPPPVDGDRTQRIEVVAGERTEVDFVREARALVEVSVFAGSEPVQDARVSVSDASNSFLGVELALGGVRERTDATGRARFEGLEPGRYKVTAAVPGAPRLQEAHAELLGGQLERVQIWFGSSSVRGRVLDASDGTPVPGVHVQLTDAPGEKSSGGGLFGGNLTFKMDVDNSTSQGQATEELLGLVADRVTTDADGRFELEHLDAGRWVVTAGGGPWLEASSDVLTLAEDDDAPEITLRVERGATISGQTIEGSTEDPLDDVKVLLVPIGGGDDHDTRSKDGRYRFEGIPAGNYRVVIENRDGPPRAERTVTVDSGGQTYTVHLVTLD